MQTSITLPRILLAILLLPSLLSGCSKLNCTSVEDLLGGRTDLVSFSYKICDNLINDAMPQLIPGHPDMPVVVTTFVDNNNLSSTNKFGRILQEHISSRLVQNRYTVKEIKLGSSLFIEPKTGETILTRDLTKLNLDLPSQAILVGTYSQVGRTLYISARLVNPSNNIVISADDHRLCMDNDILSLFGMKLSDDKANAIEEPSQSFLNKILY